MINKIGEYIFDSDRLIFYKADLSDENVEDINKKVAITDNYEELKLNLHNLNPEKMINNSSMDLIGICLTYNCQLRCDYCGYSSSEGHKELLTPADVEAFVIKAIKHRKIKKIAEIDIEDKPLRFFFTGGGEPTYNWELFTNVVKLIKEKSKQYNVKTFFDLTTNGVLNEEQRVFIKNNFDRVMVSYDGMPEIENKNRCSKIKDLNVIVEKSIDDFINSKLGVTIRSTVWYYDFNRLIEMCDFLSKRFRGKYEWSVMPILPSGRAVSKLKSNQFSNYNFFDYYIRLVEYEKNTYNEIYISTPIFSNVIAEYCCGATFVETHWLMPDKSITNCIEAEKFRVNVGKIDDGNVELFNPYNDSHLEIVKETFSNCRDCIAYRFCKGGCPVKVLRDRYFNTDYREYECYQIKQYWKYVFEKILSGEKSFGWYILEEKIEDNIIYKLVRDEEILK